MDRDRLQAERAQRGKYAPPVMADRYGGAQDVANSSPPNVRWRTENYVTCAYAAHVASVLSSEDYP